MPIPVTCPECQYDFLVGDEFAGRPGRCPECAAIIHVPAPDEAGASPDDHDPYRTPRGRRHEPVMESLSPRGRSDDWEREQRNDYDEAPRGPAAGDGGRTFDPHARAARWESVSRGLRNLMVAVILVAVAEMVSCAFTLIDPVQPGQQNNLGPKEQALVVGNMLFSIISLILWALGRIGCGRVPYVPARRVAMPAGVIAGLTALSGVFAFGGLVGGILIMQQNQGVGALLLLGGVCAFIPLLIGFPVAEIMGLVSQVRIANGLRDAAFARASRLQILVAIVLTGIVMVGFCVFFVFLMAEMQKAQKKQQEEQQQQMRQQGLDQPADPKAPLKGKGKVAAKKNAPAAPGQPQQQPPPELDLGEYPGVVYGIAIGRLLVILIYAAVSVACFQLGRRAIRREVSRLVGDPHDRDPY
jgi:hypothetical protein